MQLPPEARALPLSDLAARLTIDLGDTVNLPDGRRLGYAEFGDPHGVPVLLFHGACSSRLASALFSAAALKHGIRLIGVDRPGMGLSSPVARPGYMAWPDDVLALADQLGLERFAVAGQSGGGVFACACGASPSLNDRVTAVFLICGMLPATASEKQDQLPNVAWTLKQSAVRPWLGRILAWLVLRTMLRGQRRGELPEMANASELDREIGRMPGLARVYALSVQSGLAQGTLPAVKDMAVFEDDLAFDLCDIKVPVRSFHGANDRNVPVSLARRVVASVPDGEITIFDDAGHAFAAWFADDILRAMSAVVASKAAPHASPSERHTRTWPDSSPENS